jgi:hypothetical protein
MVLAPDIETGENPATGFGWGDVQDSKRGARKKKGTSKGDQSVADPVREPAGSVAVVRTHYVEASWVTVLSKAHSRRHDGGRLNTSVL